MSKGDNPRPCKKKLYDNNFDKIEWNRKCSYCDGYGFIVIGEHDSLCDKCKGTGFNKEISIYHALECNCYDCRLRLSLKAKD